MPSIYLTSRRHFGSSAPCRILQASRSVVRMEGQPPLALARHEHLVKVVQDSQLRSWLVHVTTGERVNIGEGEWRLGFSQDGYAFVGPPNQEGTWADDLFKVRLLQEEIAGRPLMVETEGLGRVSLQMFKDQRSDEVKCTVQQAGHYHFEARLVVWKNNTVGAHVWWSFLDLYTALGFSSYHGLRGLWASHSWNTWERLRITLGLMKPHLRQQSSKGLGVAAIGTSGDTTERLLDIRTGSTHMIIGCLSLWAGTAPRQGCKISDKDRKACKTLLEGLIEKAFAGRDALIFRVFADLDPRWTYPEFPNGLNPVSLQLHGMDINLAPLMRLSRACRDSVGAVLGERVTETMSIAELLMAMQTKHTQWLLKQLVWFVGAIVDEYWKAEFDAGNLERAISTVSEERKMMQYYLGHCKRFHKAPFVSIAMDASRVGHKKRLFGVLATPEGYGMTYPPQATA